MARDPFLPDGPPGAGLLLGAFQPGVGRGRQLGIGVVGIFLGVRMVHHAGDMAGPGKHEFARPGEELSRGVGRLPGRDMVFLGRKEEGRGLDLGDVDRHPVEGDTARLRQQILLVHLAQIETVHGARHARGIRVPVEQIEGEGVLSHQIVVDDEGPNQVIGAQHVEGGRHMGALKIALLVHLVFDVLKLLFVDKDAEIAGLGKVDEADEEGRALDPVVALLGHIGECRGEQRAAQAITDDIGLAHARRLLHGVEGGQRRFEHVVLEAFLRQGAVRIDPGDHEDRVALFDRPFYEGVLGAQVEDVKLVDPGRHDQQGPFENLFGRRIVLDQFHQVVAEDDPAGGDGDILADLEGIFVGHGNAQLAFAPLQITEQVLEALHQVLALGFEGRAQDFRVGDGEICGRQGIDELLGVELDLLRGLFVEPIDFAHGFRDPGRGQQIRLLDVVEDGVLPPGFVLEPAVVALRADHRLGIDPHHARSGVLPERHVVLPQVDLSFEQLGGIGHHLGRQVHEGRADIQRVDGAALALVLGAR